MRAEGERSASWVARQRAKMERGMRWMDERLGTQPFCVGDSLTLADVAADCALGYLLFRFGETDWRGLHPNLARLHATLSSRPAFASSMSIFPGNLSFFTAAVLPRRENVSSNSCTDSLFQGD